MPPTPVRMLTEHDAYLLLVDLCEKGGYCLGPEVRERLQNTPPDTPAAFASAVLRAEGFDPDMEKEQYRRVLQFVEQAFQRSTSDT